MSDWFEMFINIFFAEEEVVSIGDSGSENEADENNHSHNENHSNMNGFDHPEKKQKLMVSSDTFS